ncbi:iron chaperone [Chitinophaga sp. RAB17]|uniref:iron chaperone n=1 Tax=Chitinophaga sp. RAB17 TaxID=3233049 RepID=UPI003F932D69
MKSTTISTIDEYIAGFPPDIQEILEQVRATVKKSAPKAEETISYGMPAFKQNGHLVYFAAFKNHIGFYPIPSGMEQFKAELAGYKTGKGSVQFPLDEPMPLTLIGKIVKFRVKENEKKSAAKKKK